MIWIIVFIAICLACFLIGYYIGRCRGVGVPVGSPDEEDIIIQAKHWQGVLYSRYLQCKDVRDRDPEWTAPCSENTTSSWTGLLKELHNMGLELQITDRK